MNKIGTYTYVGLLKRFKRDINEFIERVGKIDIEDVKKHPVHKRLLILRNRIVPDGKIGFYAAHHGRKKFSGNPVKGVALIKPELARHHDLVYHFFSNLGCNPIILPTIKVTHGQWMSIYSDRIKNFPEIVFLYFTQRAFGLTPVLFNYPKHGDYINNNIDINALQVTDRNDLAEIFNVVYCGHANVKTPNTIRWEVTRPILTTNGFTCMDSYASVFDPFDYFSQMPAKFNFGAFNGIHLPDNYEECLANAETLFGKNFHEKLY